MKPIYDTPTLTDSEDIERIVRDVNRKCTTEASKRNKLLSKVLANVLKDRNGNGVLKFCQKPLDFFDSNEEN